MEAGRALDAEVAVKVLKVPMCPKRFIRWTISGVLNMWDCPEHGLEGCVSESDVPHYSTDIAAAWKVVEHMRKLGYEFHLIAFQRMALHAAWFDLNPRPSLYDQQSGAGEESAPLAICRAALAAVGAEVPAGG